MNAHCFVRDLVKRSIIVSVESRTNFGGREREIEEGSEQLF